MLFRSLGKKTRLDTNLKRLENHGFIVRKGEDIAEGPLLDLLLDYDALAPRILQGALGEVLAQARNLTANLPLALTQASEEAIEDIEDVKPLIDLRTHVFDDAPAAADHPDTDPA